MSRSNTSRVTPQGKANNTPRFHVEIRCLVKSTLESNFGDDSTAARLNCIAVFQCFIYLADCTRCQCSEQEALRSVRLVIKSPYRICAYMPGIPHFTTANTSGLVFLSPRTDRTGSASAQLENTTTLCAEGHC